MTRFFSILFLVAINIIVFGQTITFEFIDYDDRAYLVHNTRLQHGLSWGNIEWAMTTGYYKNWHPVTWWSYFLDYEMFGLNAGGFHFTNVVIHILATVFLFLGLTKMTARHWESLVVAALFAIHPLHVQSVAWVSERKDVLSGMFMGLTILAYYRYSRENYGLKWYLITLTMLGLGLMSKSMLVTMPIVLLLLDYWPLNRLIDKTAIRAAILDKLPMVYMVMFCAVITFIAQSGGGATMSVDMFGPIGRLLNAMNSYVIYLLRMVWPIHLSFYYPLDTQKLPLVSGTASGILVLAITVILWKYRKAIPHALMGWLWYLVTLIPVIGLVQVGTQANADRYTYIPLIGIFIAIVYTLHPWLFQSEKRKRIARIGYVMILSIGLFLSFKETLFWHNSALLAGRTLSHDPNNSMANSIAAVAHWEHQSYEQADAFFRTASENNPNSREITILRSTFLAKIGRLKEAKEILLNYHSRYPEEGETICYLGHVTQLQGNLQESKEWYLDAIRTNPLNTMFHVCYANLLARSGELVESLAEYDIAFRCDPENAMVHHNRASALFFHYRTRDALPYAKEALRLDPECEDTVKLLAEIHRELEPE